MENFKIFSGTANLPLAQKISQILGKPLAKIEIVRFADSEVRVRIEEEVANLPCFIIASLSNPVDSRLIEFCLIVDALKENQAGKITAVIPYFGYARQDKAHRPGEGVSARVMARLIEAAGLDKVITVDLHSGLVTRFFKIPLNHLFGLSVFLPEIKNLQPKAGPPLAERDDLVIVAPDAGGVSRAQEFAQELGVPLAYVTKKRDLDKIQTLEVLSLTGGVKGKTCVIVDEVITGGGTVVGATKLLKENGGKRIIACATHANFVEGTAQNLNNSEIEKIYVSDTIFLPRQQIFPKLEIVSIAPLLVEAVKNEIK